MALPLEVEAIIELMNQNVNVVLVNRERMRSLFDDSVGLSAKALIATNDWTMLRDLWVSELNDAIAGLTSAKFQIQNLTEQAP